MSNYTICVQQVRYSGTVATLREWKKDKNAPMAPSDADPDKA